MICEVAVSQNPLWHCLLPRQGMHGGLYKRRKPEKSDLYRIAYQHFEEYEKIYPERYEEEYGKLWTGWRSM
jgi:hypothetical protein